MNTHEAAAGPSWIKRIVVAADGSPASVLGLEQATDLAARIGAKVVVVHVRHVPALAMAGPYTGGGAATMLDSLDEVESEVRQQAVRILGGSGVTWEFVVRSGSAGEEIVNVVSESGADILVVGSNRHSSLHNLVLGSTAAYLTAHSPVPVLVMRALVPAAAAHSL
jgi:nucleotide-binding universal stress UspA family protein